MSDDQTDGSPFEVYFGFVIFWLLVLGAAYALALVAECLTKNVLAINSNAIIIFLDHSVPHPILVSILTGIVMLGGLWVFHWFFKQAALPWLEALVTVVGIVLAGFFPFDLCRFF